jgi:hydroxymethylpyrimidine pyrophosphatase-like HAD family hydrolase
MNNPLRWKLLAVDLDGTLLDSQLRVPEANRQALRRAAAAGLRIVLCTGRSYAETRPIIEQLNIGLEAAVTVFGTLLVEVPTGRTLERRAFAPGVARELTSFFRRRGYTVLWLNDPEEAGVDGYILTGPRHHPGVDRWVRLSPCRVVAVEQPGPQVPPPVRISVIDEPAELQALSRDFVAAFDGQMTHNVLHVPAYDMSVIEVFTPGVDKWYGICRLCQRWGIDPAETVAIGDDVNDLAMVRNAGLGVAVANAHQSIRQTARRVVASNDACGVAELVDYLLAG